MSIESRLNKLEKSTPPPRVSFFDCILPGNDHLAEFLVGEHRAAWDRMLEYEAAAKRRESDPLPTERRRQ